MDIRDVLLIFSGAVIGAVVDRAAGPVGAVIGRAGRALRDSLRLDHQTIARTAFRNDHGGRSRIHVNISCAPARRWKQNRRIHADRVDRWRKSQFHELPGEPDYLSPNELVRYQNEPNPADSSFTVLSVWPNGLIEYSTPLEHETTEDGVVIELVDVGVAIANFVRRMADGAYESSFGIGKAPKLDWFISLSQAVDVSGKGWTPWRDLSFPGRKPTPRPTGMNPPVFGLGLAEERLQGLHADSDPIHVCAEGLVDLLERNGYQSYEEALQDALAAIRDELSRLHK